MTGHDLDTLLRNLPTHDVDLRVGERIRTRALKEFESNQAAHIWPLLERLRGPWRWFELALSTGIVGTYLAWMAWTLAGVAR